MTVDQLKKLESTMPNDEERVDIRNVKINMSDPVSTRAINYLSQIKNPYAFKHGDLAVNVEFTPDGKTLKQAVTSYLVSLKGND